VSESREGRGRAGDVRVGGGGSRGLVFWLTRLLGGGGGGSPLYGSQFVLAIGTLKNCSAQSIIHHRIQIWKTCLSVATSYILKLFSPSSANVCCLCFQFCDYGYGECTGSSQVSW
jgi:hypothetical protein